MAVGDQELLELDAEFLKDLEEVFDDRADEFSTHLLSMLLELWSRARARPGAVDEELEQLRELKQQKDELRDLVQREFKQQLPAVAEQFKSQIESVLVDVFNTHLAATFNSGGQMTDEALCRALERVVSTMGLSLTNFGSKVQLMTGSADPTIPELALHDPDDEWQAALRERLKREGLLRPDKNWVPVYVHAESGRHVGLESDGEVIEQRRIDTLLTRDNMDLYWVFPNPRPLQHLEDNECRGIELWVNDYPTQNASCTWHSEHDVSRGCQVITKVTIPNTSDSDVVRARYLTAIRRWGVPLK